MSSISILLLLPCTCLFLLLLLLSATTVCARDYDYSNGTHGPQRWGSIHREWAVCSTGTLQSPINLTKATVVRDKALHKLEPRYESSANASMLDWSDHDIAFSFPEDAGDVLINGTAYQLLQVRVHSPSEHMLEGKIFPAEVHFIHNSTDGSNQTAIIAFHFKIGRANAFIEQALEILNATTQEGGESTSSNLDPSLLRMAGRPYYKYTGSLTSPPCSEGVEWYVIKKNRRLSQAQFQQIQSFVNGNNARPLQQINGRAIESYK